MTGFSFNEAELRPLVKSVVAEVLAELEQLKQTHDGRLAYTETEAANMLGLNQHQLRDIRLRREIGHSRIVGDRIRYTIQDLVAYLNRRRQEADA